MNKRNTIAMYLTKTLFASTLLSLPILSQGKALNNPPNVVLINIDDLGWTDLSGNGSNYYETPNIDKLISQGVWFSQAYASAANSAPSRACLLTGQYTPRHGMYTVNSPDRGNPRRRKLISTPNVRHLPDNIQMLPRVLKSSGYQTCHIGKWHVTSNPLNNGVDKNIAGCSFGHPKSYFSPYLNPSLEDGRKGEYLVDRLGNEAVNYLRNVNKSKPFFLYYATYAVHTPLKAPQALIDKYRNKKGNKAHHNPIYGAMVEIMDRNVGKVLREIKSLGIEQNTIVIFTSDNGGVYRISKQWPLRAGKGSFYEGGIKVPLVIYQKGRFEQDKVTDINVSQIDLFPTILDFAGIKANHLLLDGKSLLPLLNGEDSKLKERSLFWHFPAYLEGGNGETVDRYFRTRPVSVIRKGDFKLIQNIEDSSLELYNLKDDPSERHDLVNENTSKAEVLYKELKDWQQKVNAPIPNRKNPKYKE